MDSFFAFIVPLILVLFGTFLGCLILWKIFDMVRSSIKGKNNVEVATEDFDRLARAFMHHKKEMEKRIQNVEAIITDDIERDAQPQLKEPKNERNLSKELKQKDRV